MRTAYVCAGLVFAGVLGCGGGGDKSPTGTGTGTGGGNTPEVTTNAIDVRDNSFNPTATTVNAGTTVTWTWRGNGDHDVTFNDGAFSGRQNTGNYERTFPTVGRFPYHCTVHGLGMSGEVVVR